MKSQHVVVVHLTIGGSVARDLVACGHSLATKCTTFSSAVTCKECKLRPEFAKSVEANKVLHYTPAGQQTGPRDAACGTIKVGSIVDNAFKVTCKKCKRTGRYKQAVMPKEVLTDIRGLLADALDRG